MTHVQTVLGPVNPERMHAVLAHEHVTNLAPGPRLGCDPDVDRTDAAVSALSELSETRFDVVVDLSAYGTSSRAVELLPEIARRSQTQIVAGSGFYLESFAPAWALESSADQLRDRLIRDATEGVEATGGVRVGILGEQGTSLGRITAFEERCLRAVARAARVTGLAIYTHTMHSTMAREQLAVLAEEKTEMSRVVVGHMDIAADIGLLTEVLRTGATVGFDTLGKQSWDFMTSPPARPQEDGPHQKQAYARADHTRLQLLWQLIDDGWAQQIVLSSDVLGHELHMNPDTLADSGLAYIDSVVLPWLQAAEIPKETLEDLVSRNPLRLLTLV